MPVLHESEGQKTPTAGEEEEGAEAGAAARSVAEEADSGITAAEEKQEQQMVQRGLFGPLLPGGFLDSRGGEVRRM